MTSLKKRVLVETIFVILVLSLLVYILPHQKTYASGKISGLVIDELSEKENVRVMITMNENVNNQNEFFGIQTTTEKEDIMEETSEAIRHDLGDKISAELTQEEIFELSKKDSIESIEVVNAREIFLNNSIPLIEADLVHNLSFNSNELKGNGQSICIIDTGVDYTHQSLGNCSEEEFLNKTCKKVIAGYDFANLDNNPIDDHGHGTHVAGIVSGVAPSSSIIAIKACTNQGYCYDDDIMAGIQWCINNQEKYNISVISMSLGSGLYSTHCSTDVLAPYINNATAHNIAVVIASGNYGNSEKISAPSCVESAIPIGSSTKTNLISSFSNRNSLLKLLAPGSSIYSTIPNNKYTTLSGTSMATPHVAAAIAILNQYLRLVNKTKTPSEIENILANTGLKIQDSTQINYSRIALLNALISIDNEPPTINLLWEINQTENTTEIKICNATDLALARYKAYLWNSTKDLIYQAEGNLSKAQTHTLSINTENLAYGIYYSNCEYQDLAGNKASANENKTIAFTNLKALSSYPENGSLIKAEKIQFQCNASSAFGIERIGLIITSNTTYIINDSIPLSGESNSTIFEPSIEEGNYTYQCYSFDNLSSYSISEKKEFSYESTILKINVYSPENNQMSKSIILNISIEKEGACNYSINDLPESMESSNNKIFSKANISLPDNSYNLTFKCLSFDERKGEKNLTFTLDNLAPRVLLISPETNSEHKEGNLVLTYSKEEENQVKECRLILDNEIERTTTNDQITISLDPGRYRWKIECEDRAGNVGISNERIINIKEETESNKEKSQNSGSEKTTQPQATPKPTETQNQTIKQAPTQTKKEEVKQSPPALKNETPRGITGQAITEVEPSSLKQNSIIIALALLVCALIAFLFYQKRHFLNSKSRHRSLE